MNSLFYHHGNQSAISVVRIFKNTTLFRKHSNVQRSLFFAWRVEISRVRQDKNHPTYIKNYSSKSNQQLANGAYKDFFYSYFIELLWLQFYCVILMQFVNNSFTSVACSRCGKWEIICDTILYALPTPIVNILICNMENTTSKLLIWDAKWTSYSMIELYLRWVISEISSNFSTQAKINNRQNCSSNFSEKS